MKAKDNLEKEKLRQKLNKPKIRSNIALSKNGKWIIRETTITEIKPIKCLKQIIDSNEYKENGKR